MPPNPPSNSACLGWPFGLATALKSDEFDDDDDDHGGGGGGRVDDDRVDKVDRVKWL